MKGFIPQSYDNGNPKPFEYLPATSGIAVSSGTALTVTAGKLALATGTTAPSYISMAEVDATTDGQIIPVIRVAKDVIFETSLSVEIATIARGAKYTISADGNQITATTASGVAEVVSFDGTAAGSKARVRF